jgi:hypothetical protein
MRKTAGLDEVLRYAQEHAARTALDEPLSSLHRFGDHLVRGVLHRLPDLRQPIRRLFADEDGGLPPRQMHALGALRAAAISLLEQRAAEAQVALIEERVRLERPAPADPAVRALVEKLLALRARLRLDADPRPPLRGQGGAPSTGSGNGSAPAPSSDARLVLTNDPPGAELLEHEVAWREVRVRLAFDGAEALVPRCSVHEADACEHALLLVDSLLDRLHAAPPREDVRALLAVLDRPAWDRALLAFDRRLAPPPTASGLRIGWMLRVRGGQL